MTHKEAVNLKAFKNYCNCGGFSHMSNKAKSTDPHYTWCAQYKEYNEWKNALDGIVSAHAELDEK
jgi:hypothetical protein